MRKDNSDQKKENSIFDSWKYECFGGRFSDPEVINNEVKSFKNMIFIYASIVLAEVGLFVALVLSQLFK